MLYKLNTLHASATWNYAEFDTAEGLFALLVDMGVDVHESFAIAHAHGKLDEDRVIYNPGRDDRHPAALDDAVTRIVICLNVTGA